MKKQHLKWYLLAFQMPIFSLVITGIIFAGGFAHQGEPMPTGESAFSAWIMGFSHGSLAVWSLLMRVFDDSARLFWQSANDTYWLGLHVGVVMPLIMVSVTRSIVRAAQKD